MIKTQINSLILFGLWFYYIYFGVSISYESELFLRVLPFGTQERWEGYSDTYNYSDGNVQLDVIGQYVAMTIMLHIVCMYVINYNDITLTKLDWLHKI